MSRCMGAKVCELPVLPRSLIADRLSSLGKRLTQVAGASRERELNESKIEKSFLAVRSRARSQSGAAILTPNVHAPIGLLELGDDDGRNGEFLDVARAGSPSLEEVLRPVARLVARLPPIRDEFPRHLQRIAIVQADLLATEGAALTLVGGFTTATTTPAARCTVVFRIVHRVLYAARAALHDELVGRSSCLVDRCATLYFAHRRLSLS